MAKGYWIVHLDVTDVETFTGYAATVGEILAKRGGRYLVRAERNEQIEGSLRQRHVVIEFPSYDAARACYDSPEYAPLRELRIASATTDAVIAEGFDD